MTPLALSAALAWLTGADRNTLVLLGTLTRTLPWWGRATAAVVRDGPVVGLLLWIVNMALLSPGETLARAAQVRALAAAAVCGIGWAVAWAVVPLAPVSTGFARAAAAQAVVSALPLGAALLALGAAEGAGAAGMGLRALAVAYALARLAIGADGPLRVLAEAVSAVVATLLLARVAVVRAPLDAMAQGLGHALGLAHAAPAPAARGRGR